MSFLYLGYLILAVGGALALSSLFQISFSPLQRKAIVFALAITACVFTIWDILAVMRNHWAFGLEHTVGIIIVNQPIEEMGFFLAIPFFGIVVYEIARAKWGKKK